MFIYRNLAYYKPTVSQKRGDGLKYELGSILSLNMTALELKYI